MDRSSARALVAAIGQFLVDNCDGVAAYFEEMTRATAKDAPASADPAAAPEAPEPALPPIPELAKGSTVRITVATPDSPAERTFRMRVDTENRANRKGCGYYEVTLLDERGRPCKHDKVAITHFDERGWQPLRGYILADWAGCYRFEVVPEDAPAVDGPGNPARM